MRQEIGAFAAPAGSLPVSLKAQKGPCRRTVPSHRRSQCCIVGILAKFSTRFPCTAAVVLSHLPLSLPERQRRRASAGLGLVEVTALSTLSTADVCFFCSKREKGEPVVWSVFLLSLQVACWSDMNILLLFLFLFKSRTIRCDSLAVLEIRVLCSHGLWVPAETRTHTHTHTQIHMHIHAQRYTDTLAHTHKHTHTSMHIQMHTHTHTHTQIHTLTHTQIHMHIQIHVHTHK